MTAKQTLQQLREAWLNRIADEIIKEYERNGHKAPKFRVSCGFPSAGRKGKAIGECWTAEASADKTHEIFIHPNQAVAVEVAAVLCHELGHAIVGLDKKHGPVFKAAVTAMGLEGKMKATYAGEQFIKFIKPIIESVGVYPHGRLDTVVGTSSRGPKQQGRMRKAECPECGYIIRASKAALEVGIPKCPNKDCGHYDVTMVPEIPLEEGGGEGEGELGDY